MAGERRKWIAELVIHHLDERASLALELFAPMQGVERPSQGGARPSAQQRDDEALEEEANDVEAVRVPGDHQARGWREVRGDDRRANGREQRRPESPEHRARGHRDGQEEVRALDTEGWDRELECGDEHREDDRDAVTRRPAPRPPKHAERKIKKPFLSTLHNPSVALPRTYVTPAKAPLPRGLTRAGGDALHAAQEAD